MGDNAISMSGDGVILMLGGTSLVSNGIGSPNRQMGREGGCSKRFSLVRETTSPCGDGVDRSTLANHGSRHSGRALVGRYGGTPVRGRLRARFCLVKINGNG